MGNTIGLLQVFRGAREIHRAHQYLQNCVCGKGRFRLLETETHIPRAHGEYKIEIPMILQQSYVEGHIPRRLNIEKYNNM